MAEILLVHQCLGCRFSTLQCKYRGLHVGRAGQYG